MCGRYRLARKKEILAETFGVEDGVDWILATTLRRDKTWHFARI